MKESDYDRLQLPQPKYSEHNATALCLMIDSVDQADLDAIVNFSDAKDAYDALHAKYFDHRRAVATYKLRDLTTYQKKEEESIQDAWTTLHKMRKDIVAIRPNVRDTYDDEELLMRLLDSLPPEYSATVDTIKARETIDINNVLRILKDKEGELKSDTSIAMAARVQKYKTPQARQRQADNRSNKERPKSSVTKKRGDTKCFICNEEGHRFRDCKLFSAVTDFVQNIKEAYDKSSKKAKKAKAFEATSDSEASTHDSDDADDTVDEIAHASIEAASKHSPTSWIADSGASSHMTDKLHLFSGPLEHMRRRTIKVGGGYLHSDRIGDITLLSKRGTPITINSVYYVPGLGANLMSTRRLCKLGLHGTFNENVKYLHDSQNKKIIKAVHTDGVYMIKWISSKLPSEQHSRNFHSYLASDDTDNVFCAMNVDHDNADTPTEDLPKRDQNYILMHRRLAHLGPQVISKLHLVTTHNQVFLPKKKFVCSSCAKGKMKRSINHVVADRKEERLALISLDACGPLPLSHAKNAYFIEVVDNHTRKVWTLPVPDRKSIPSVLDEWKAHVELEIDKKIKAVRLDNASEHKVLLASWSKKHGIVAQETEPYTSHQNGVAERSIQTTEANIRAMIDDAQLPIEFWDEAARTNAYLRNRTPRGPEIDGLPTSPEQAWNGKKPSIDHLRVWGCKCYSYVDSKSHPPNTRRDKLMPKAREAVLVGYDDNTTKQYKIFAPDLGRVVKASTVIFDEDIPGGTINLHLSKATPNELVKRKPVGRPKLIKSDISNKAHVDNTRQDSSEQAPPQESINTSSEPQEARHAPLEITPQAPPQEPVNTASDTVPEHTVQASSPLPQDTAQVIPPTPEVTIQPPYLPGGVKRKRDLDDDIDPKTIKHIKMMLAMKAMELEEEENTTGDIPIPKTYEEAVNDPVYGNDWLKAIQKEIEDLQANGTWKAEVPPAKANIVDCKWVFAVKYHTDGSVERFKARLVAKGFSQLQGIDYEETFAPTVRMDTMRVMLAIVAVHDLEAEQIDVNNAFTESTLNWTIFMKPPPGMNVEDNRCLRLLQSLYGLKQAAFDWYNTCDRKLVSLGFTSSNSDPCMYLNKLKGMIILVYVDDITIIAHHKQDIAWFKKEFRQDFKIKDLGDLKKILGVEIKRDRRNRTITIHQSTYIKKLLKNMEMEEDRHRTTDIPMNGYDSIQPATPADKRIDATEYARKIGKLIHAMTYT